jgi:hypothetical protein
MRTPTLLIATAARKHAARAAIKALLKAARVPDIGARLGQRAIEPRRGTNKARHKGQGQASPKEREGDHRKRGGENKQKKKKKKTKKKFLVANRRRIARSNKKQEKKKNKKKPKQKTQKKK